MSTQEQARCRVSTCRRVRSKAHRDGLCLTHHREVATDTDSPRVLTRGHGQWVRRRNGVWSWVPREAAS